MKVEVRGKPKMRDPMDIGYVILFFPHLKILMLFNKKKPCRATQYLIFLI